MEVRIGNYTLVCKGFTSIPTPRMLAEADKRIIYLGDVKGADGRTIQDAFIFSLKPNEALTIDEKSIRLKDYGIHYIELNKHSLDSSEIEKLAGKYDHEVYIGTVCVSAHDNGIVFHDVYADSLLSKQLYRKDDNGRHIPTCYPKNMFDYIDRRRYRIIVKQKDGEYHYAFEYAVDAYNKWLDTPRRMVTLHNLIAIPQESDPYINLQEFMAGFPKSVQHMFNESFSTEGFLKME